MFKVYNEEKKNVWYRSGIFIVNFELIWKLNIVI